MKGSQRRTHQQTSSRTETADVIQTIKKDCSEVNSPRNSAVKLSEYDNHPPKSYQKPI
ncbi:MAG: hypothetical protein KAU20_03285 [Nanoarchaeota archaeon]|nr:hypothetical protein [Nanoarchaeota archaeon]